MMINSNSGGHDDLALVRFSQISLQTAINSSGLVTSVASVENWSDQGFMLHFSVTIDGLVERPGLLRQLGI